MEAGLILAAKLKKYKGASGVVLAVPRGGIPVAYAIAKELGFPLDIILTKKIGHPLNKEYAIGAASLSDFFVIPHENVTDEYIESEVKTIRTRLKEMYIKFMGERAPVNLHGKTVLIVDDGIATGNTLLGTIQMLRKSGPKKMVIAAPVASYSSVQLLQEQVDEVVTALAPDNFYGVGAYYEDFEEVTDEEVLFYLEQLRGLRQAG